MADREETFLDLLGENRQRLRRIARLYAAGPEDAEDLYQEMVLEAWRSLPSFRGDAKPATWLYRVALNTALGRKRKRDVRRDARLDDDSPLWGSEYDRPDERLARERRAARLHREIGRLEEGDRALVILYMDDLSYAEMSDILGISENYVGVKLHRIRTKLAKRLQEEET